MRRSGFPLWYLPELLKRNAACFARPKGLVRTTREQSRGLSEEWPGRLHLAGEGDSLMQRRAKTALRLLIGSSFVMQLK